jgi:predicted nucleic acid-binding protein
MMVKNKAYDVSSYSFVSKEAILIDANIWMYLFPPPSSFKSKFVFSYSKAFSKLLKAEANPILDPMVLSEYLNRYCRIEWEACYKKQYPKFKDFRNSRASSNVIETAQSFASKIVSFCCVHSIASNQLDLQQILADFASDQVDFNDAVLIDICKKGNLKIMTNDGDFQVGGIDVLTSNSRLLKQCG